MKKVSVNLTPLEPLSKVGDLEEADTTYYDLLKTLLNKHEELSWISRESIQIKILLNGKIKFKKGRKVLGEAKVFQPKEALYHRYNAQIILDEWYCKTNPDKVEPLLFHELCYFYWDEELNKIATVGHDFEEFYLVFKKYGDWNAELSKAQQLTVQRQLTIEGLLPTPDFS